jgi:hypothetical protein
MRDEILANIFPRAHKKRIEGPSNIAVRYVVKVFTLRNLRPRLIGTDRIERNGNLAM